MQFKWLFMAIIISFEHIISNIRGFHYADLNGLHGKFNGIWASRLSKCILCKFKWVFILVLSITMINVLFMQNWIGFYGNFNGLKHQSLWCIISFMNLFTSISECVLCRFKWLFVAVLIGFAHKQYRSVYYANLNAYWASIIIGYEKFHGHIYYKIRVYVMQM